MFEVGKFYEVPAIQVDRWHNGLCGFVPIIGPEHDDTEIVGFSYQHYHVDWRFVTKRQFEYFDYRVGWPSIVYGAVVQRVSTHGAPIIVGEPTIKRMKCKRELPPYPHHEAKWIGELAAKFACTKLINGTCPHRGIHVSQMIREGDILTCPGHGLRWNAITGEAVPPPDNPS